MAIHELPRGRRAFYRSARVLDQTVRGFFRHQDLFRAAALTYIAALSFVPFLAFAFALLKGFGGYTLLVEKVLQPYIVSTFGRNQPLERAIQQLLVFVGRTNVSTLGVAGLLFIMLSALSLLANVEGSLNDIWGVSRGRSLLRRFTDYTALIVIVPLLVLAAATMTTASISVNVLAFLRTTLGLGPVIDLALQFASTAVVALVLTFVYALLPNTHVRRMSAFAGGVVGGILWHLALISHVKLQIGVAGYNALYSGFAAVPVFLFWMYLSWIAVLLGAEVAASHQNDRAARSWRGAKSYDETRREQTAVAVMTLIGGRFLRGEPPWTATSLAEELGVPPAVVAEVLRIFERSHIVSGTDQVADGGDPQSDRFFLPARDPYRIRAYDVVSAVRHAPAENARIGSEPALQPANELIARWEAALSQPPHDTSIGELASQARPPQGRPHTGAGGASDSQSELPFGHN